MTTKGTLPITEMIRIKLKDMNVNPGFIEMSGILRKCVTLEQSQIQKEKQEEKDRIVGILKARYSHYEICKGEAEGEDYFGEKYYEGAMYGTKEAINFINNQ